MLRDLADISLSHVQEGSTTRSTKFVSVAMGNYFLLPQIPSVSVTRIPVNKYRLIPYFIAAFTIRIAPHGVARAGAELPC